MMIMDRFHAYASDQEAHAGEAALAKGQQQWVDPWVGNTAQEQGDALYHDCSILPPGATPPELVRWLRVGKLQVLGCSSP